MPTGEIILFEEIRWFKQEHMDKNPELLIKYWILDPTNKTMHLGGVFNKHTEVRAIPRLGVFFLQEPNIIHFIGNTKPFNSLHIRIKKTKTEVNDVVAAHLQYAYGPKKVVLDYLDIPYEETRPPKKSGLFSLFSGLGSKKSEASSAKKSKPSDKDEGFNGVVPRS